MNLSGEDSLGGAVFASRDRDFVGSNFPTINRGTCAKSGKNLTNVIIEKIEILEGVIPKWKGAYFVCPHCHVILSVGLDPLALNADLVDEILKNLGNTYQSARSV